MDDYDYAAEFKAGDEVWAVMYGDAPHSYRAQRGTVLRYREQNVLLVRYADGGPVLSGFSSMATVADERYRFVYRTRAQALRTCQYFKLAHDHAMHADDYREDWYFMLYHAFARILHQRKRGRRG